MPAGFSKVGVVGFHIPFFTDLGGQKSDRDVVNAFRVAVDCGALPDTLIESEHFGYKAGAFTAARQDTPGRFTQAGAGTVFPDEIGDVPLLVDHFVEKYQSLTGKHIVGVTEDALAAMALYNRPGNVRELENAIEHAFVLCREKMIKPAHLPEHILPNDQILQATGLRSLKEHEKRVITDALVRNHWRRMATARELEIHKNTLRRKIEQYGIREP